jgi:hypothetical protein
LRPAPFTHPDWTGAERLLVYDNAAFREGQWLRDHGHGLVPHWAYAAGAFVSTTDRHRIEWTPGVPDLRMRQVGATLEVQIRSATPNFAAYEVRFNDEPARSVPGDRVSWPLAPGRNKLAVRTRNLFGILGPEITASVEFEEALRDDR